MNATAKEVKEPKTVTKLTQLQTFKLMKIIDSDYIIKKMTDSEFAKYASEQTGEAFNSAHVTYRREALGIEGFSNVVIKAEALPARVLDLEETVRKLQATVKRLSEKIDHL